MRKPHLLLTELQLDLFTEGNEPESAVELREVTFAAPLSAISGSNMCGQSFIESGDPWSKNPKRVPN